MPKAPAPPRKRSPRKAAAEPAAGADPSTGDRVREIALALFRERGFEKTTMRDIAREAGLSLGAAYYYYRSKDAIVLSYYESIQERHLGAAREVFARTDDVGERLAAAFDAKLELLRGDRRLLGALFRAIGDPESPVSLFSEQTEKTRRESIALYAEALTPAGLPEPVRETAALGLWAAHLGLLLYFLHDESKGAARTKALSGEVVALLTPLVAMLQIPGVERVAERVREVLTHAGLDESSGGEPSRGARSRPRRRASGG